MHQGADEAVGRDMSQAPILSIYIVTEAADLWITVPRNAVSLPAQAQQLLASVLHGWGACEKRPAQRFVHPLTTATLGKESDAQ